MSHIAVDLKVIEVLAPGVARGAGIDPDRALGGLVRLWHRCWSTKATVLSRTGLASVFGVDRIGEIIEALRDADFIEASGDEWRICGVEKYLRVSEARSRGGKSASGNLKRGTFQPGTSPGASPADSRLTPGSAPALTPSTEHRAPSTEHRAGMAAVEIVDGHGFWRTAQDKRIAAGLVREREPHGRSLSTWFSLALLEEGVTVDKLLLGYDAFLSDPWWRNEADRPCSWGGWVSQWQDFVTKATAPGVARAATPQSLKAPAPVAEWTAADSGEQTL